MAFHQFSWRTKTERLSWSYVEQILYFGDSLICGFLEVCILRCILSYQPIGVFIQTSLPRMIGLSEIELCVECL